MSQTVEQRRRGGGVRLGLGAAQRGILQLVIGRVAAIAAAGISTGLVLAVTAERAALSRHPYRSSSRRLALVLLGVTLAAGYPPRAPGHSSQPSRSRYGRSNTQLPNHLPPTPDPRHTHQQRT